MRIIIGGAIGLLVGAAVGQLLKARGGTCPLACNPYGGALFGALLGVLVAAAFRGTSVTAAMPGVRAVATQQELDELIRQSPRPVVVDFYTDNCGFCVRLAPIFASLGRKYASKAEFVKVDAERVSGAARQFQITGVPVVIAFVGGREVRRWTGLRDEREYRSGLDEITRGAAEPRKEPKEEAAMAEKPAAVTFKGKPLTLVGKVPAVGEAAPDFTVTANDLSEVKLSSFRGKVCVVLTVPSLDTRVCNLEARRFNAEAGKLGAGVAVLVISMDLPFAQERWCGAADARNVRTLSDYRGASAGRAMGVLIRELHLLARAVFVLDRDGKIAYEQVVPEMTHEPDYDAALAAVKKLTN